MAQFNLQSMGIGLVIFVFVIIFGSSLVLQHVDKYDISLNDNDSINTLDYSGYSDNLSDYKNNIEDGDLVASEGDQEGILGAISKINKIFKLRDDVTSVTNDVEGRLGFLPSELWVMIGIILGIIFVAIIVGFVWRYNSGLN